MIIVPQIKKDNDGVTDFRYLLPYEDDVSIKVYDHHGTEMDTILECKQDPGEHNVKYDTSHLPTGKDVYMIKTNYDTVVKLMSVDENRQQAI